MSFTVTILGTGSAMPTASRRPSAQLLNIQQRYFLVDCGEGTQMQLKTFNVRYKKISHVFISHLHGDHFFGLVGFVSTLHLLGRKEPLVVFGPEGLREMIELQFKYSNTILKYKLEFKVLSEPTDTVIHEDDVVRVSAFPLVHSVPCWGFRFDEKPKPFNIRKDVIEKYDLSIEEIKEIKNGADYTTKDGKLISNDRLVEKNFHPKSYAYCADTIYSEDIVSYIKDVDVLYHEATFANDLHEAAKDKFHATAGQAANIAKLANARQLVLGHFSARYEDMTVLLNEASAIFPNTLIGEDGQKILINKG